LLKSTRQEAKRKTPEHQSSGVFQAGVAGLEPATSRSPEPDLHLSAHPALQKFRLES